MMPGSFFFRLQNLTTSSNDLATPWRRAQAATASSSTWAKPFQLVLTTTWPTGWLSRYAMKIALWRPAVAGEFVRVNPVAFAVRRDCIQWPVLDLFMLVDTGIGTDVKTEIIAPHVGSKSLHRPNAQSLRVLWIHNQVHEKSFVRNSPGVKRGYCSVCSLASRSWAHSDGPPADLAIASRRAACSARSLSLARIIRPGWRSADKRMISLAWLPEPSPEPLPSDALPASDRLVWPPVMVR